MNIDAIWDTWMLIPYETHEYEYYMRYKNIGTIWNIGIAMAIWVLIWYEILDYMDIDMIHVNV